jgi:rubredoxin
MASNLLKRSYNMERWICTICQYVYDPATGDPDRGIPAGTSFESLPDEWCCPLCGAGKDVFEKE